MRVAATKTMKIALAKINSFVGDIENNSIAIIKRAKEASKKGAELLITPELSICGYPPEDLVLREDFLKACSKALSKIAQAVPSIKVIVGHPLIKGKKIYNAASLLFNGKIQGTYFKKILPNYGVFYEKRNFETGKKKPPTPQTNRHNEYETKPNKGISPPRNMALSHSAASAPGRFPP